MQEEIIETNEVDETENVDLPENPTELTELELEPEFPMYVVMDVEGSDLFGFYVLLICSLLIMYPVIRALKSAIGGVARWR